MSAGYNASFLRGNSVVGNNRLGLGLPPLAADKALSSAAGKMRTADNFYKASIVDNSQQANIQLYGLPHHMIKSFERLKSFGPQPGPFSSPNKMGLAS
jgi:hypothetical protein